MNGKYSLKKIREGGNMLKNRTVNKLNESRGETEETIIDKMGKKQQHKEKNTR